MTWGMGDPINPPSIPYIEGPVIQPGPGATPTMGIGGQSLTGGFDFGSILSNPVVMIGLGAVFVWFVLGNLGGRHR